MVQHASIDPIWTRNAGPRPTRDDLVLAARSVFAARRALTRSFPAGFLHDPVLEVLLCLYIAQADDVCVTASHIADVTGINRIVARRWIAVLEREGLTETIGQADGESSDTRVSLTRKGDLDIGRAIGAVIASQILLHGPIAS